MRFVLTLDADTILPIGAAAVLVGTLVHPLNRPQFDASGRVVHGYGILQPRITPALPTRIGGTRFQQLFSGNAGVDPYTFQVFDINQDLFGEGTFTGKGLYDVDAFEASLAGQTPENAILSHASESGAGYTWAGNSRENQLTPWSNDPVSDPVGEAFYLLDRDSGILWTPTALPIRVEEASYISCFGHGYVRFQHRSNGIESDLVQFVASEDPVKISRLRLINRSSRTRRISITAYVEWVLGFSRTVNAPFVVTEIDSETGGIFACNPWNREFGSRIAFVAWDTPSDGLTCDRQEFVGRNGHLASPVALAIDGQLSGRYGAAFDP